MKNDLFFDFTVDKPTNTVFVTREFDANLSLVWDAYTKPELLDQWWAPKPYESRTKFMDFKVGGRRFYAMVSPDGQEQWLIQEFTAISPKTNFQQRHALSDKDQNVDATLPRSEWNFDFSEKNSVTTVKVTIDYKNPDLLERMIEKGFRIGMTMTLAHLDDLLATLKRQQ